MRFDHSLIFVTEKGELLHASKSPEYVDGYAFTTSWQGVVRNFTAVANIARKDWLHTYVYLQPDRDDPFLESKKVAMGRTIASSNLHAPACWYHEISRSNKQLLPISERKLIIGSEDDVNEEIDELLKLNANAILYGLCALRPGMMRYRNISDVPSERLDLCVNSLFNAVVVLSKSEMNHRLVKIAKQHGIPVEEMTSKGGVLCTRY